MERTSELSRRCYVIASWIYVTGYWRWAIYWTPPTSLRNAFRWPRGGPGMDGGKRLSVCGNWSAWADLPIVGALSIRGQPALPAMKHWPAERKEPQSP
jgi:hypothetical protein